MQTIEFLVVGQGLAGTMVSWFLERAGRSFLVVDQPLSGRASEVSAGIINPITGRRFTKSWLIDELLPFARATYREIEREMGISLWSERRILRALTSVFSENEWHQKCAVGNYGRYMSSALESRAELVHFKEPVGWGETLHAAQVDLPALLSAYRLHLANKGRLLAEIFRYESLLLDGDQCTYGDVKTRHVIFCEGFRGRENPWFSFLPHAPTKGDLLLVRLPAWQLEKMIKYGLMIAPLREPGTYWVGATTDRHFQHLLPEREAEEKMVAQLRAVLKVPFEVIAHLSGVRPTVKGYRPFVGRHPKHPNLIVFNGLGMKGTSLAPYFAHQLVDHLLRGLPLHPAVSIERFFA